MAITKTQNGAQSVTYFLDEGESTDPRLDQNQWADLRPGKLKDLLNRTYVTPEGTRDIPAFMRAAADAGMTFSGAKFNSNADITLRVSESQEIDGSPVGTPFFLVLIPGGLDGVIVRIQTAYSASE